MNDIDLAVPLMDGPSYDRACSLVPSEYVEAWEWFLGEEQRGGVWGPAFRTTPRKIVLSISTV